MRKKFPNFIQRELKDCGPTCIKIIAKHYGKLINTQYLRELCQTTREGSNLYTLSNAIESLGFKSIGVNIPFEKLKQAPTPCILYWNNNHYVVLYKIKKNKVYISDPEKGLVNYSIQEFIQYWIAPNATIDSEGIVLLVEPTPRFYQQEFEDENNFDFSFILKYILQQKKLIFQLFTGLFAGSLLQIIFPFLTQSIVDIGIKNKDISFVYLILFAQLSLFLGKISLDFFRSWILLHISTRLNVSLVSDFFIKLMKLPIAYFDTRMTGDLMQRINDHKRIETIFTTSSLNILFSVFNFIVFSFVLSYYNTYIFLIFLTGSFFYFLWIALFLKKRKKLDYKNFDIASKEQSKIIELINGMQEIKLHNAEKRMRWDWEYLQARMFKIAQKSLSLEQVQTIGSSSINQIKDILISVLSATLVIQGDITLGIMMAITYIVGQLNGPVVQFVNFITDFQDAKISLERLAEIHSLENEEKPGEKKVLEVSKDVSFRLENATFSYSGAFNPVIKNLNLHIPKNKTTAIVGTSGSGKTTLMKILLGFYQLSEGNILIDNKELNTISIKTWRESCGVVMQEGYIFNASIAKNIAVGEDNIDINKLNHALKVSNIQEYIDSLPLGLNTLIGSEGIGLSTGQKQRLLIARAVYKDPKFLFFDEATSALDANNEKIIMNNLNTFFEGKTAVVIAHRLSTVKNAHQIVVLDKGRIVEIGNHQELILKKGNYYHLVKNQLELGS